MNARQPGTRRGAHRSRRDVVGAFVPSLLAVLAVTALITAIYVWRGEAPDTATPANASTERSSTSPTSTPAPSTTTSKAPVKPAPTASTSQPPATKTKTKTTT